MEMGHVLEESMIWKSLNLNHLCIWQREWVYGEDKMSDDGKVGNSVVVEEYGMNELIEVEKKKS